jgi:hypothetical protein
MYGIEERCIQGFGGELKRQLVRFGIDGRIIVKLILKKWDGEAWTRLLWIWDRDR